MRAYDKDEIEDELKIAFEKLEFTVDEDDIPF